MGVLLFCPSDRSDSLSGRWALSVGFCLGTSHLGYRPTERGQCNSVACRLGLLYGKDGDTKYILIFILQFGFMFLHQIFP